MPNEQLNREGRRPRYAFKQPHSAEAWLERDDRRVGGVLTDFSRHGAGLRVAEAVETGQRVTVCLRHAESGLDLSLPGCVRWARRGGDGWIVGCELDEPVPLETLGELFLRQILVAQ